MHSGESAPKFRFNKQKDDGHWLSFPLPRETSINVFETIYLIVYATL